MSTTKYATTYRINPATAAKAFTALVDEGLLVKKRGIGMFVATGARERLRTTGRARFIQDSLLPVVEEALALGLTPNDLIDAISAHAQSAETHTKEH